MADDVICYLDFPDQCVVVWVKKLISLVVREGDRITVLTVDFCDVLCHVYILSPGNLPCLTDITSPATCGVTSGSPFKDGVDNVLGLRSIHLVVLNGCDQWGVLAEPPHRCFWPRDSLGPFNIRVDRLPLLWSILLEHVFVRFLSRKSKLFSGYQASSPDILISIGMLPVNSPQVREGWWDIVGDYQTSLLSLTPSRYEVSIFRVYAPRNVVAKAFASCLKELIDPGANL
ncbi:hypothetical protein TIFTF001_035187 [Ficus carica]|uniref:Uncharacterized protein n=1 Tax=Ficus carica TaxID=3494 RepID=A0AA88E1Z7_FICCA|nr:hypothetical protein TIFTF001_035187 [Ficus carica]